MQLREVSLGDLVLDHPKWINPRLFTGLDDDSIKEFSEELKERGILDPPKVQQIKVNGDVVDLVIDGQRRVKAALKAFGKTHKISVEDRVPYAIDLDWKQSDEIMLEVLAMGQHRQGLSSYELSEVAAKMHERGRTFAAISDAIGRDASWVSKIMKARETASPKLMLSWKKGEVTDEVFKDLAALRDKGEQEEATKKVVEVRQTGDKAEARILAKEVAEKAKKSAAPAAPKDEPKTNGHSRATTKADGGDQVEMWKPPPPVAPKKHTPAKHVLEELVAMVEKRPATHDYVKGVFHAVKYVLGDMTLDEFAKPWHAYVARVGGTGKPAKKTKAKATKKKGKKR